MMLRYINSAILTLVALLTLTGTYGIFWTFNLWMYDVHRIAGWALIALIPWKVGISARSLKRGLSPRFDRGLMIAVSLLLTAVALLVLGLALAWAWNVGPWWLWLGQTAVSWHWMLALGLVPPFMLHAWRRWPRPRRSDFLSRRAALRTMALGGVGVAGWLAANWVAEQRAAENAGRRITGSRQRGSFSGNDFPITNGAGEGRVRLDPQVWALSVSGALQRPLTLSYEDILAHSSDELTATLDCTLGWYSTQIWRGPRLSELLARVTLNSDARAVRLVAESGYLAEYSMAEARQIMLATHVGGEVLNHQHGFPLRAVVPFRRGWFWVKWVTGIEVLGIPRSTEPVQTAPRAFLAGTGRFS